MYAAPFQMGGTTVSNDTLTACNPQKKIQQALQARSYSIY